MNIYLLVVAGFVLFGWGVTFGLLGRLFNEILSDKREANKCEFRPLDDDNALFETGCGKEFYNAADDGDYVTSWLNHCPYCGGKAKQTKGEPKK